MDRGAWQATWDHKELNTTEVTYDTHKVLTELTCDHLMCWKKHFFSNAIYIYFPYSFSLSSLPLSPFSLCLSIAYALKNLFGGIES